MTAFEISAQIAKTDADEQIVFGWASVSVNKNGTLIIDRQEDVIYPDDLEYGAYDFVLNSRRADSYHDELTKAHLVESMVFTPEKLDKMGLAFVTPEGEVKKADNPVCMWWTGFYVPDEKVWKQVLDGEFTAFSIGGSAIREPLEV